MTPSSSSTFVVPAGIGALLARLPAYPGSVLLCTALNIGLASQLLPDVRQLLLNRKLRIHVRDARLTFDFAWGGHRFVPLRRGQEADLVLSANGEDFLRLAQRQEDPDTLFFSRRLMMEGDTELGLVVKNTLDALETPVLDLREWSPGKVFARFAPPRQTNGMGPRHPGGTRHD